MTSRRGVPRDPPARPGEALPRGPGGRRRLARHRAGRVLLAARAVRLRQDDDAADDRRLRAADRRPDPAARPRRHRRPARQAPGQHGLPELRAVPPPRRRRQRRVRAASARTSTKAEITRRVGEALELVHLAGYERRKPNQLSGGQQQRVALARALVNRPNVLLLDEPLGALDLKLRRQLQIELKRIQTEVGITFVYVTHDQEEALTMSDRIAVMHAGKVEQLGHARGALRATDDPVRGRLHRHDQPAARHGRAADGAVRLVDRASWRRVRRTTGCATGTDGRDQRPPGGHHASCRPAPRAPIRGQRRAGRLPRDHRLSTRSARRRARPHRPGPEDRDPTPGRQRCRRHLAAVRGARPRPADRPHRRRRSGMNDRHDGSTHRPRAGARPLHGRAADHAARAARADRRGRRRRGARADHRRLHGVGAPSPSPAPSASAAASAAAPRAAAPQRLGRADPGPARRRRELIIYNWTDYIGENTIPSFEDKYGVKVKLRLLREHRRGVRQARRRRRRLRPLASRSRSTSRRFVAKGALLRARQVADPEHRQPRRGVGRPGLRPGQRALDAVHVVDDRRRLRHRRRSPTTPTSSKALWDPR